ncbi:MAG: formate--tetrahydrofolate ligase [Chitinophagaceae bacterium]
MKSDIEIAKESTMQHIVEIAASVGIADEQLELYGKYKAKVNFEFDESKISKNNLILVTATTPNKSGSGKTTTSIALAQGLKAIGKKAILALREPSLGPCFGMKGGAAGGGYSQVLPMEDINLHFTGDFHAITSANNTLAALIDNYRYFNRGTAKDLKTVLWKRVLDVNDRSLRYINTGLNGNSNGIPTETGFDITPASEIMAILCLSNNLEDLRTKIDNILVGYTYDNQPFFVKDLEVGGAITVLLKDAIKPNLVQSIEGNAAFLHGGPFANIAHGCNSIMATKAAMQFGDYTITEAGFGSDLGAEKFLNIKCRAAGITPKATVLVTSTQTLKLHGGIDEKNIKQANIDGLVKGFANLDRHIESLQNFGQTVVVAVNKFNFDTEEELQILREHCEKRGSILAINDGFANGGQGAIELANKVVEAIANKPSKPIVHTYQLQETVPEKLTAIVQKVYKGAGIVLGKNAQTQLRKINEMGFNNLPVCIAKTQYSFTDDATKTGVEQGFTIFFDNLVLNAGAGFIVAVAGEIMRMPGLPKIPQAKFINIENGEIVGLS